MPGDLRLLQRWVDGDWAGEDFLTVTPGEKVAPSYREDIIQCEPEAKGP